MPKTAGTYKKMDTMRLTPGSATGAATRDEEMNGMATAYGKGRIEGRPLRRIVAHDYDPYGVDRETLECGHIIHRRHDSLGPTVTDRRRCDQCRQERLTAESLTGAAAHTEGGTDDR